MYFSKASMIGASLVWPTIATIDVGFFTERNCPSDNGNPAVVCKGLKESVCCWVSDFTFPSVEFRRNNGEEKWYGTAFENYQGNKCGRSCGAVWEGGCVNCNDIVGANWFYYPQRLDPQFTSAEQDFVVEEQEVDTLELEGHSFRINYDVPKDITQDLMIAVFRNHTKYDDLPEYLKEYEVKERVD